MPLKNKLNQYELDTALAVLRDKNLPLDELKSKTVAVSGGSELHKSIIYSLLCLNDEKGLGIKVISVGESIPTLYDDDYFTVAEPDELGDVDLFIEAGFLRYEGETDSRIFADCIDRAMRTATLLSRIKAGRVILLSSAACYGSPLSEMTLSESEYTDAGFSLTDITAVMYQCVENIFAGAAHTSGFELVTMRAAALIAPFGGTEVGEKLLSPVIKGDKLALAPHGRKTSFVYINDLLTAIYYGALLCKPEVYNVSGPDSGMSPLMLAAVCEELFGSDTAISDDGIRVHGCSINCDKLKKLGYTPLINDKDALLIAENALSGTDRVFMFSDSYDGKLSAVQSVLLGFLKEVDRICRKHDIKYFLGGGTLLGAVRHKGFIPWDDDADVMMLREDYEKFLSVLPDELPSYITDQNTDPDSHFAFTKLRLDDTVLSTEFSARFDIHNGVFLDVLAQDKTSDKKLARKLHMKMTAQLRWLVLNKWRKTPMDANNKFVSFIGDVIKTVMPLKALERMQNRMMTRYRNKQTKYLYDSMGRNVERGEYPIEWLDEAVYVDFEDTKLPIPKKWEEYLTYLYGDYMSMIPVSERHVSHDIVRIDLGRFINY